MEIRIDIENPLSEEPELIGLWLEGFGWIVGGGRNGSLSFRGSIKKNDIIQGGRKLCRRFLKHVRENAFSHRFRPWRVGEIRKEK